MMWETLVATAAGDIISVSFYGHRFYANHGRFLVPAKDRLLFQRLSEAIGNLVLLWKLHVPTLSLSINGPHDGIQF